MTYKKRALILALVMAFSISSFAQGVSMKLNNVSVKQAMSNLKQQSGYSFVYEAKDLDTKKKVSVNAKDVKDAITQILKGQNVSYTIQGKYIIIKQGTTTDSSVQKKAVQNVRAAGCILDDSGEPVVGATIAEVGGKGMAVTDIDGNFSLNVPEGSYLLVSYIGYKDAVLRAGNNMSILLTNDEKLLEEVVVVGYGKQSEKLVTTSISTLKIDDVDQGNDYNVAKMMQGRVTGVSVSTPSGTPGQQPNVRVRGIASISGNSSPLYVVDGIPSETMPVLNPNDVERMDILKDASAAAIYGSRANNGVVIITTKSGQLNGKTTVGATLRHSIGWIANDIEMANSSEYIRTMQQAVDNYNVQMGEMKEFIIPDKVEDTNWVKLIQRNAAHTTNANVNIQGGNAKTTFFASLGMNDQQGIMKKSEALQTNFRTKFSHIINNVVKLNLNLTGSYTRYNLIEDSDLSLKLIRTAREEQPWINPYDEETGRYEKNGDKLVRHNPVMLLNEEDWVLTKKQGVLSVNFEITPFKGFKYTPSFSLYGIIDDSKKSITERHDARRENASWGAITQQRDQSYRIVFDNVLSYDNSYNLLLYSLMAGHSYEKYAYEPFGVRSDNYTDGAFPSSSFGLVNSGPNIYAAGISYNAYAIESYFGRVALNWDNRYILNATIRCDGSSRFTKDHRYGTFPSASVAWRISNESFYPQNSILNDLKLRVSWGKTGSMDGIGNWAAMSLVTAGGSAYNGASGFKIGNESQNLSWEKAEQSNIGINGELFNGRMSFSLDAFYSRTTGLLYNTSTIATSGYSSQTANIGKLENQGVEFMLSGRIFNKEFKWDLSGNISYVKNRLLSLDGSLYMQILNGSANTGRTMHALIVGKPVSAYYMLQHDGLYQRDSEVPSKLYAKGVRAGDSKYRDIDGDGDITDDDRMYVGKVTPDFYGGITSTMNWKNFDLTVFCQYSVGGKILAAWKGAGGVEGTETLGLTSSVTNMVKNGSVISTPQYYNISKYAATHYWHGEGTSNTIPRPTLAGTFTGGYGNNLVSTRYLEDASYFKFKTITLGYNIPAHILSKFKILGMRLYVSLDNFFTLTKYDGYDPEFSYQSSPTGHAYGSDFGEEATLKSFVVGVNINL